MNDKFFLTFFDRQALRAQQDNAPITDWDELLQDIEYSHLPMM